MITKDQALTLNHFWFKIDNPRNPHHGEWRSARRNGKTQTWKTRPLEFKVPVKYGLYEHFYVTDKNSDLFFANVIEIILTT